MGLFIVILFALGLCFDTFAVSVSAGMGCGSWSGVRGVRFAFILGFCQALMPFVGWLLAAEFHTVISAWDHWIAFGLLAILGGKMIVSGIKGSDNAMGKDPFTLRNSALMGLATSIDALIAGVTLALIQIDIANASQFVNVLIAVGIIGFVTVVASIAGLTLGRHTRGRLGVRAEIIGGVILVLIGVKVLYEHLGEPAIMEERIEVVSFNIRYDNPSDGPHNWHHRKGAIVAMFKEQMPDVIGIQEGLCHQVKFLDSALVNYKYIGVGRDDGDTIGEYAAIFYDTTRLTAIKSGNFWLSDTTDRPSFGWDAVCIRIASWGLFEDRGSGKQFFVVNTHFDHVGTMARTQSGRLIISKVDSIGQGLPMVLTGDFNCTVADGTLEPILNKMSLARPTDSKEVPYTFIGFDAGDDFQGRAIIDHIFVRGMLTSNYRVITNTYGAPAGQLSDHLPVGVDVVF